MTYKPSECLLGLAQWSGLDSVRSFLLPVHARPDTADRSHNTGLAQVVGRIPLRHEAKVDAVSPPAQPLDQLMLPAAKQLAAQAPGRTAVGAPVLGSAFWHAGLTALYSICAAAVEATQVLARALCVTQPA